jgi:hypothetical protein
LSSVLIFIYLLETDKNRTISFTEVLLPILILLGIYIFLTLISWVRSSSMRQRTARTNFKSNTTHDDTFVISSDSEHSDETSQSLNTVMSPPYRIPYFCSAHIFMSMVLIALFLTSLFIGLRIDNTILWTYTLVFLPTYFVLLTISIVSIKFTCYARIYSTDSIGNDRRNNDLVKRCFCCLC